MSGEPQTLAVHLRGGGTVEGVGDLDLVAAMLLAAKEQRLDAVGDESLARFLKAGLLPLGGAIVHLSQIAAVEVAREDEGEDDDQDQDEAPEEPEEPLGQVFRVAFSQGRDDDEDDDDGDEDGD